MCFRPPTVAVGGEVECPLCGAKNPADADACSGCGATADSAGAPKAPAAPKAPKAPAAPKPPTAANE